jgi:hypothetical protein
VGRDVKMQRYDHSFDGKNYVNFKNYLFNNSPTQIVGVTKFGGNVLPCGPKLPAERCNFRMINEYFIDFNNN